MANQYMYGAYATLGESVAKSAIQAGTTPVYVGVAPINLVRNYTDINGVNRPVKLSNFVDAQRKLGYSPDWAKFSLCEPMTAHFNNALGNIGPIWMINVLDPEVHKKNATTQKQLTLVNGRAEFVSDTIILDTFAVADKVEGLDYSLDYNYTKNTVVFTVLDYNSITSPVNVTFDEVDLSLITADEIIGGVTANGEVSGLGALKLLYQEHFQVCNLLAAPGWSHDNEVFNALLSAAQKINGHWDAYVMADLPLVGEDDNEVDTITKAIAWSRANGRQNERSKSGWPMAIDSQGQVFHWSTWGMVESMRADFSHNSVPMETCGNKQIPCVRQYFGAESKNAGFDQQEANELTQNGISTFVSWGGRFVLWGNHTSAYTYGADLDPRGIFDVSIRMLFHIMNSFQRDWGMYIDEPMTLAMKDRILSVEQEKLDGLVAMGALLGNPQIMFLASENSTTDLMNGDFTFDLGATPTPPFKSGNLRVSYTSDGFTAYFGDENN